MFSAKNRKFLLGPLSANNPVIVQILGICSALAVTVKLKPAQIYASGSGLLELVYNTIEQEEQDEGLFDRIKRAFKKR